ncbi:MAG: helix-turn-helix transcriptional regulator [Ignavibacteria bacterium]|nr:helix-turn-helix transcriptional regulator [Ignavibacteria bacterium]
MDTSKTLPTKTKPQSRRSTSSKQVLNEREYKAAFAHINTYLERMKGNESKLTPEEHAHFRQLALAIQEYEQIHFPLPTRQEVLIRDFTVGEWNAGKLRAFRKEFNLKQANLAQFLGVNQSRIAEMERGDRAFSTTTRIALDRVAEYIRTSLQKQNSNGS